MSNNKPPPSQFFSTLSCDEFDEHIRPAPAEVEFETIMAKAVTRRDFFKGSAMLLGTGLFAQSALAESAPEGKPSQANTRQAFEFEPVAANTEDTITLPHGYQWKTLLSWGDPLWSQGERFDPDRLTSAHSQAFAFGDNNDGMESFVHQGRQLLAINNEYINFASFYRNRPNHLPMDQDDVIKAQKAVGVSIVEIEASEQGWQRVVDSPFNRKITAHTPIEITGPARGHPLMKTQQDPKGIEAYGTWANCGSGRTPWGTYLTCEENFNGFYSASDPHWVVPDALQRYGLSHQDRGYAWGHFDERFDLAKNPNEPNRSGYVVEIDPTQPDAKPKKRTALGRFKHENAEVTLAKNGQIVIYLGDDERGEFLYRYVSDNAYQPGADTDDLMNNGTLYAAKFHEDGSGEWRALTPATTGMSQAEICIHTRQAASSVHATTMDRPEWVAVHPHQPQAYCASTNNKNRGVKPNQGGDPQPVGGPNPRAANQYGQIIRWLPADRDHGSNRFHWNLFVMAGNPDVYEKGLNTGSPNIHSGNLFNAPDGLQFDTQGQLWIQTDGKTSNQGDFAGMGNNQMLVADPETGDIRRFMVGPKGCEITGLTWSHDKKTLFVGIQHPGEKGGSTFPDGRLARSSVVALWRTDNQPLG
jgi:secreted PhoX family phosphatase